MGVLKVWDGSDWRKVGCGGSGATTTAHVDPFTGAASTTPIVTDGITWLANVFGFWGLDGSGTYLLVEGRTLANANSVNRAVFPAEGPNGTMTLTDCIQASGAYATGACWRVTTSGALEDFWCLLSNGDVRKVVGNVADPTVYLSCGALPSGATIAITCSGDVHEVFVNGVSAGSFSDSFNNTATGWGVICDLSPGYNAAVGSFSISTTTTAAVGRLRLQLPDESWVQEVCDGETGHPLKIEDPANPGTWITVACMRPV